MDQMSIHTTFPSTIFPLVEPARFTFKASCLVMFMGHKRLKAPLHSNTEQNRKLQIEKLRRTHFRPHIQRSSSDSRFQIELLHRKPCRERLRIKIQAQSICARCALSQNGQTDSPSSMQAPKFKTVHSCFQTFAQDQVVKFISRENLET